jgi:hypothetical protein
MLNAGRCARWLALMGLALAACAQPPGGGSACASASDCTAGLVCVEGTCGACRRDADCAAPQRCGVVKAGVCGCADADGDGSSCEDCDDGDPTVFAGAAEACDGKDNDCDQAVDEGVRTTFHADQDRDGFGDPALTLTVCAAPVGYVRDGTDCNDADPTATPGRLELCDFRDNDCDGDVDEGVRVSYFRDADGDGFGDANNVLATCQTPASGYVSVTGDCDDTRADVNPGAQETCNARDDDCDGAVDGLMRSCSNACGPGSERCSAGLWAQCSAPPIVTVNAPLNVSSNSTFSCMVVGANGRLTVSADVSLHLTGWLRAENTGVVEVGPRASLSTDGDLTFTENSMLLGSDATLNASGTVRVLQNAKWYFQAPQAPAYSGGGSPACASLLPGEATSGAGGGARGGAGGRGGTCGALQTQPRSGAGGASAAAGSDGCLCPCSLSAAGAPPSGGAGGATLGGGGGGANGGAGGAGGAGRLGPVVGPGGLAGLPEPGPGQVPLAGGAAGGSGGAASGPVAPEACQGGGGAGAGIVRVHAARLRNEGLLAADGASGETSFGSTANVGGGGGGAGGTWVLFVDRLENLGAISAVGGRGGNGRGNQPGGGGGGGGGRVYVRALDGGVPIASPAGALLVGGGAGGTGPGGNGANGAPGWVAGLP